MPEGDTLLRTARALDRALAGKDIERFWSPRRALEGIDLRGARVANVRAKGKNVLLALADGRVLHTHMKMTGAWHIYRPGAKWRKPLSSARAVLETSDVVAVCFDAPVVRLFRPGAAELDPRLRDLGPDVLAPDFDAARARENLRARGETAIGLALLDQRALAGVGNIWRAEALFAAKIDPLRPVASLTDAQLDEVIAHARRLMTHATKNPRAPMKVYGRAHEPCPRCARLVRYSMLEGRAMYHCASCQE
jgi:endonuclease-8